MHAFFSLSLQLHVFCGAVSNVYVSLFRVLHAHRYFLLNCFFYSPRLLRHYLVQNAARAIYHLSALSILFIFWAAAVELAFYSMFSFIRIQCSGWTRWYLCDALEASARYVETIWEREMITNNGGNSKKQILYKPSKRKTTQRMAVCIIT